jgi:hypothetical protein
MSEKLGIGEEFPKLTLNLVEGGGWICQTASAANIEASYFIFIAATGDRTVAGSWSASTL